ARNGAWLISSTPPSPELRHGGTSGFCNTKKQDECHSVPSTQSRRRVSHGVITDRYRPSFASSACTSANSASVNSRERVWKALPVLPSSEKVQPWPGTTSMINCVCFQYSYCEALM